MNRLSGMLLMAIFFLLIRLITKGGMGYGDIQYALYCGFIVGCPAFIIASLLAAIFGIIIYLFIRNNDKRIPFVLAMMMGSIGGCIISFVR